MNLSGKHTACIFRDEGRFHPEDEDSMFLQATWCYNPEDHNLIFFASKPESG
jgi:hypothetical protein